MRKHQNKNKKLKILTKRSNNKIHKVNPQSSQKKAKRKRLKKRSRMFQPRIKLPTRASMIKNQQQTSKNQRKPDVIMTFDMLR